MQPSHLLQPHDRADAGLHNRDETLPSHHDHMLHLRVEIDVIHLDQHLVRCDRMSTDDVVV